jgi:hypothetical protein
MKRIILILASNSLLTVALYFAYKQPAPVRTDPVDTTEQTVARYKVLFGDTPEVEYWTRQAIYRHKEAKFGSY